MADSIPVPTQFQEYIFLAITRLKIPGLVTTVHAAVPPNGGGGGDGCLYMKVCDIDPPDLGRVDPVDNEDNYDWDTETETDRNSSLSLHQYLSIYFKRKNKREK